MCLLKNVLIGAVTGAVAGGVFNQAGNIISEAAKAGNAFSSIAQAGIHATAGAIVGGVNSAISGGDIGMGMLTGAISAGVAKFAGNELFGPNKLLPDKVGYELAGRSLIGGITGGITAAMTGGQFEEGFALGGMTAAAGFVFNKWYHEMAKGVAFGFAAAGVVTWEAAKMVTSDVAKVLVTGKIPSTHAGGFAMDKSFTALEVTKNVAGDYQEIGERVGSRIETLKQRIYGKQ